MMLLSLPPYCLICGDLLEPFATQRIPEIEVSEIFIFLPDIIFLSHSWSSKKTSQTGRKFATEDMSNKSKIDTIRECVEPDTSGTLYMR